jgi:hypothetical protein
MTIGPLKVVEKRMRLSFSDMRGDSPESKRERTTR